MIIECPSCTSRYRISDDKLPETGGNIKCPNCAHVFFVVREGLSTAAAAGPQIGAMSESGPFKEAAERAAASPDPAPAPPAAAPAPQPAAAPAPKPKSADGRWKLKNAVGLVYDFPATEQLRTWLGTRESHDGFQVSNDGGETWVALADAPELSDVKPNTRSNNSGSGATKPTDAAARLREEARKRLEAKKRGTIEEEEDDEYDEEVAFDFNAVRRAPEAQKTSKMIAILAAIILPAFVLILLQANGTIDLGNLFGGSNDVPQYVPPPRDNEAPEDLRPQLTPEQTVNRLMTHAAAAQSRNEPAVAIEHLEDAVEITPDDTTLHCLLEPLYTEIGNTDAAAAAAEACNPPAEASGEAAPEGSGADGEGAEQGTDGSGEPPTP